MVETALAQNENRNAESIRQYFVTAIGSLVGWRCLASFNQ
jgi:transcriptional/translational regulatory protein YebC/TACO1